MEVPDEDQVVEVRVCGCFIKVMYGTRQAAWAWQEEALVHGGDFVIVTRRWHAKEIEKRLRSKRESVVQRERQRQKRQQRR